MRRQPDGLADEAVQRALKSVTERAQRLQRRIDGVDQRTGRMGAMNPAPTVSQTVRELRWA